LNVNDRPLAVANGPYFVDAGSGERVNFRSDGSRDPEGGTITYFWDFGDGNTSTLQNPQHPYATAGIFLVTLTVTDPVGLTGTSTAVVNALGLDDTPGPLLQHTPVPDGRPTGTDILLSVNAQDQTGVASVLARYRRIGTVVAEELVLVSTGGNQWQGTIPGADLQAPGMAYWFVAVDSTPPGYTTRLPAGTGTFQFTVLGDQVPPVITHTPVPDNQPRDTPVTVTATITDATGVGAVNLYQGTLTGALASTTMSRVSGDVFSGQIPAVIVTGAGVRYDIEAFDQSPMPNRATSPPGAPAAFHSFTVQSGDVTPPAIAFGPIPQNRPASQPIALSANVIDNSGTVQRVTFFHRPVGSPTWASVQLIAGAGSAWSGATTLAPEPPASFTVTPRDPVDPGEDTTGPVLTHNPPGRVPPGVPVAPAVLANDPSGVDSVVLRVVSATGAVLRVLPATRATGSEWRATIPGSLVTGAELRYWWEAFDDSPAFNPGVSPADAPATTWVVAVGTDPVDPGDSDAGMDAGQDAGPDAGMDAGQDAGPDAGGDADAGDEPDAGGEPDADRDADADGSPDVHTGSDTGPDAQDADSLPVDAGILPDATAPNEDASPAADALPPAYNVTDGEDGAPGEDAAGPSPDTEPEPDASTGTDAGFDGAGPLDLGLTDLSGPPAEPVVPGGGAGSGRGSSGGCTASPGAPAAPGSLPLWLVALAVLARMRRVRGRAA
jgi:PKD repeat protein